MRRLPGPLREIRHPRAWPVRWRLAGVSAVLTFVILVVFALVVGRLTSNRLKNDFNTDIRGTADAIASETQLHVIDPFHGVIRLEQPPAQALRANFLGNDSAMTYVLANGAPAIQGVQNSFGPPNPGGITHLGDLWIAAAPVRKTLHTPTPIYVEYARDSSGLSQTIDRLWLFLGGGVLGGTALALLAGLAVASRAMNPVRALTAAAHEIATTRDPSKRVPQPESEDEIAELASTLDQMLRQLDAARSETEQMIQAQREFVADASHELRTPLTSILANLELLQARLDEFERGDEEGEIVDSALRSSRRMGRLVSDLLLLARADAGRTGIRRECDLTEVAASAVSEVRPVAGDHELALAADGPVIVDGNPDELHRLAVNLIDNGVRHTPDGTVIEIAVERRNGEAVLEVSDDGPGLPPGNVGQLFARFVRGSGPADVAGDTGTGLGLAIVKAVATSHGGEVQAGASAAGGARFTVRLPAHRA